MGTPPGHRCQNPHGNRPRHRRPGRDRRATAHLPRLQGPLPVRRRARPGQDPARLHPRPHPRPQVPAHPVHPGPHAHRHRRLGNPPDRRRRRARFEFIPGPIFANLILADEINRTPPKTQAALLEAMQEKQVTVDGQTRRLEEPFIVFATQNPIEHEGTYPLPEAQLDRFFFQLNIGYPTHGRGGGNRPPHHRPRRSTGRTPCSTPPRCSNSRTPPSTSRCRTPSSRRSSSSSTPPARTPSTPPPT